MNWHRTNLALIFILCIIDVFFAFTLYNTYKKTEFIPDDLLTEASENLSVRGIHFDKDTIDTKKHDKAVYLYSSELAFAEDMKDKAKESHSALIAAIDHLSGISDSGYNDGINYFDIPSGTSVSITDPDGNNIGSATVTGVTGFEYSASDFDSMGVREIIKADASYASCSAKAQKLPSAVRSFFEKVYGGTVSGKAVHISEYEGGKVVTTLLCADGVYIHNMVLSFYVKNGKILYVSGNMLFSEPAKYTDTEITDGINILFSLPENTYGTVNVTSQHLEYTLFEASANENYLVPSWIITYLADDNTGEEKHIILNAITGNVLDRVNF